MSVSTPSLILTTFIVVHCQRGGIVSLHLHANSTPLLEHCASEKRSIRWADEMMHKEVKCLQIKLLWFRYFLPQQRLAEAL